MLPANLIDLRGLVLSSKRAKEGTMIDTRHFGAAPNDTEKEFAAQIRTHALTLASEALSEAQVDPAHVDRITTMGRLTASVRDASAPRTNARRRLLLATEDPSGPAPGAAAAYRQE